MTDVHVTEERGLSVPVRPERSSHGHGPGGTSHSTDSDAPPARRPANGGPAGSLTAGNLLAIVVARAPFLLLGLVATAVVLWAVSGRVEASYQAIGSVLLVGPVTAADDDRPANPFVSYPSALNTTARALTHVVSSEEVRWQVQKRTGSGDYVLDVQDKHPIVEVEAIHQDPGVAVATAAAALNAYSDELEKRQVAMGIRPSEWVVADILSEPLSAIPLTGDRVRILLMTGALGVGASVALAVLAESLATGRDRRRLGYRGPAGRGSQRPDHRPDARQPSSRRSAKVKAVAAKAIGAKAATPSRRSDVMGPPSPHPGSGTNGDRRPVSAPAGTAASASPVTGRSSGGDGRPGTRPPVDGSTSASREPQHGAEAVPNGVSSLRRWLDELYRSSPGSSATQPVSAGAAADQPDDPRPAPTSGERSLGVATPESPPRDDDAASPAGGEPRP